MNALIQQTQLLANTHSLFIPFLTDKTFSSCLWAFFFHKFQLQPRPRSDSLHSRRYFFAFFRRAKASVACEEPGNTSAEARWKEITMIYFETGPPPPQPPSQGLDGQAPPLLSEGLEPPLLETILNRKRI